MFSPRLRVGNNQVCMKKSQAATIADTLAAKAWRNRLLTSWAVARLRNGKPRPMRATGGAASLSERLRR
jgi:hypothetical protein